MAWWRRFSSTRGFFSFAAPASPLRSGFFGRETEETFNISGAVCRKLGVCPRVCPTGNAPRHPVSDSAILVIYDTGQRRAASSSYSCHPATGPVLVFTSSESERTPAAKTAGFFCTCARYRYHESRFRKVRRPHHRCHPGPCQRTRPHGRLHERSGLSPNRRNRLCPLLEPLPPQIVAQGRKLRPSPGGQGDLHRLRPRCRARQGGGARPRRLP